MFDLVASDLVFIFIFVFCVTVSIDHFGLVFSNFVLLSLVFSVPSQELGWEEHLQSDLFCVEWDAKPCSVQFRKYCKTATH